MFSSFGMNYSQRILINKINQYQKLKRRPLISTEGYCHGLALLWLSKMLEQKVDWFYDQVKYIIHNPPEDYDEVKFEKFLALIEYGQNPHNSGLLINQRHLKIILDMRNIESIDFNGNHESLSNRIRPKNHPAMYLITSNEHAIAVFHLGETYSVYDANYVSGRAKTLTTKEAVASEIMARLLPPEKQSEDCYFDLEFNFISLAGYLIHPTDEVIIDIPKAEPLVETPPPWCNIL